MKRFSQKIAAAGFWLASLMVLPGFTMYAETENGSITGVIVDDSTTVPVSYASVALLSAADSSILNGMITNDQGKFLFNDLPYGKYNLKVTFVGYKPVVIKNLEVSRQNKTIDLQNLKITEDYKKLEEAVIVGQRLKGEEKVDRTVFTINDDVRKASTTALDALKHIPSVTVDFQNNVSLEGSSNIQFYVDGILRNKEYVAQIKPEQIDKVELITNPGVKYDADVSGVINIILKKEKRSGVNGSVKIPIPHPTKIVAEPSANIEYGNQKFRIYIGDQLHFERFNGTEMITTKVDNGTAAPYRFEKTGTGVNRWQNNYMNYGADWFINDKTSLNFLGEWRTWKGVNDDYKSVSQVYTDDVLTEYLNTDKNSLNRSDNYYFSLYFVKKFNKEGNEIKAEGYFNTESGKDNNDYMEYYMDPSEIETVTRVVDRSDLTENMRKNAEFKLDGTFMLKNIKNEVGARTYGSWMGNEFTNTSTIEGVTNETAEKFNYRETRQTVYYNLSGKVKKLAWQAGVRGEYSWLDIDSETTTNYTVLLPQFSLSQSLAKDQTLKLTYRKQIYRPSASDMNPFEVWTDSLHMRTGNPNLDPAIENKIEFSYAKNFKSNYISPKAYFRYTNNGIQDVTTVSNEGVTVITQDNIGKNMEYGVGINGAFQILKHWRFNAGLDVFNRIYRTDKATTGHSQEEMLSYRFNFSHIVTLPKDFTLFMFANYGSPNISYQREFTRDMLYLFGAEKKFSEKFSMDVFYNPFIKDFKYTQVITTAPGYYESWEGHVDAGQLFCFSITYNFNKGNKINKIDRNVEYERSQGKGGL
jgi:ferric enterobactin receptor